MYGHPSKDIVGTDGDELRGRRIVLGVTGSVSSYRAPDVARGLMRHGADVHVVMSEAAQRIIHPNLMEWATGNPVIVELSGKLEHVAFTTGVGRADLILIAPATANSIGKMAAGIDDTPVTSFVSSALGAGVPILVAPAMHDTMMEHSIIKENIKKLRDSGVEFLAPILEEGKAKLQDVQDVVEAVIVKLSDKSMSGLKVLVTGGPTAEPIDPVRALTNRSSGKMAVAVARAANRKGAEVTMVYGPGSAVPPKGVRVVNVETAQQMLKGVETELKGERYDLVVAAAAVSDFRPAKRRSTKPPSDSEEMRDIRLERTEKIVKRVKMISPSTFLAIFAAEYLPANERELAKRATKKMREAMANMVVVNDVGKKGIGFGSDDNEVMVIDSDGEMMRLPKATKQVIADKILALALGKMKKRRKN